MKDERGEKMEATKENKEKEVRKMGTESVEDV